jgi:hypothetical protein
MHFRFSNGLRSSVLVLSVLLCLPHRASNAADDELADLKRAVKELQLENRELANRLKALEAKKSDPAPEPQISLSRPPEASDSPTRTVDSKEQLEQRVKELELGKAAQERATRLIIQESMAKTGSKINEAVTLGGAIEVLAGRSKDFSSPYRNAVKFNTAEIDLEIQFNPWVIGSFIVGYDDGVGNSVFQTNRGFNTGVERINLDRAFLTIGDLTRFPIYFRAGRMTLPFGISTGVHRADVLTIDSPLTIDAFETRKNAFGFGFGFPTPPLTRTPPPVFAPRVSPVLLNPLISSFAENVVGYKPLPFRPKPPSPSFPPPKLPPFYGSIYFYEAAETGTSNRNFDRNIVGRLGFRAQGNCGQNYDQLKSSRWCPWSFDTNLDYNSSVFDSRFLETNYRSFANQFGRVPGLGYNAKFTFGPTSLVAEWNGASTAAVFQDDAGKPISIKPSAWQISLGYQLDWNPWIESIGAQGTFLALGYSRSRDLAGVTQTVGGAPSRIGFLPKSRTTLTVGEWVLDGVKVVVEYSIARDYSIAEGGTGIIGRGIFSTMTYSW